jgi:LmbE family N-acetylglucosaminyl deacetylase
VLHYYSVHLRLIAEPAFVLDISPYWEAKRRSMECYQSQFTVGRPQEPPTFIDRLRDQAAYWGWAIGTQYGEPFASREPVGLGSLRNLL